MLLQIDVMGIIGMIFLLGMFGLFGLFLVYIFIRKGNVKAQIWRIDDDGVLYKREQKNAFYNEKEKVLNIFVGFLGKKQVFDFPSSTIRSDGIVDIIEYNGEYFPAKIKFESTNELRATPLLDPARMRAFAERIKKNQQQTADLSKQQLFQWMSMGLLGLLIIAQIVVTHSAFSNMSSAIKEFKSSVDALNAKIVVSQDQNAENKQENKKNDNRPPA